MTPVATSQLVHTLARAVGFDLCGVARVRPSPQAAYYREWLARGYAGGMAYLHETADIRVDPSTLMPAARSVICTGLAYRREDGWAPAGEPAPAGFGRVAQYARGDDYHTVLHRMLAELIRRMRAEINAPFEAKPFVDTGPLLERELAAAAGLGWIGKNTCLLNARLGSCVVLGEVLTTLELEPDEAVADRCASCTRCIDACPTNALIGPRELDASRCIAYLTIEHRGEVAAALAEQMGAWVFGCDVCQQVCPYNARAPLGTHPGVMRERTPAFVPLESLVKMRAGGYRRLTRGTALRRGTCETLRRNGRIATANERARRSRDA